MEKKKLNDIITQILDNGKVESNFNSIFIVHELDNIIYFLPSTLGGNFEGYTGHGTLSGCWYCKSPSISNINGIISELDEVKNKKLGIIGLPKNRLNQGEFCGGDSFLKDVNELREKVSKIIEIPCTISKSLREKYSEKIDELIKKKALEYLPEHGRIIDYLGKSQFARNLWNFLGFHANLFKNRNSLDSSRIHPIFRSEDIVKAKNPNIEEEYVLKSIDPSLAVQVAIDYAQHMGESYITIEFLDQYEKTTLCGYKAIKTGTLDLNESNIVDALGNNNIKLLQDPEIIINRNLFMEVKVFSNKPDYENTLFNDSSNNNSLICTALKENYDQTEKSLFKGYDLIRDFLCRDYDNRILKDPIYERREKIILKETERSIWVDYKDITKSESFYVYKITEEGVV